MTWLGHRRDGARLDAGGPHLYSSRPTGSRSSATIALRRSAPTAACRSRCRWGQVNHLAFGPGKRNGASAATPPTRRAGSATAAARPAHLWIDAEGDGKFRRMKELAGNITSPMWIGDRVYFLVRRATASATSTRAAPTAATCAATPTTTTSTRATRRPTASASSTSAAPTICAVRPGERQRPRGRRSARPRTARRRRASSSPRGEHLESFRLHPAGPLLALVARGQLFAMALWEGAPCRTRGDDAGRMRHGQWLADGSTLVAVSDASRRGARRSRSPAAQAHGAAAGTSATSPAMRAAPQGSRVAFANHRNEVWIGDVAQRRAARRRPQRRRPQRRSRLVARRRLARLHLLDEHRATARSSCTSVAARTSTLVTEPEFRDYSPAFDPEGKYLYFLSLRTFDPVYDSVQFELSFPRAARPYLIALQAGGRPPFEPVPKGLQPDEPERDAAGRRRRRQPRHRCASTSTASRAASRRSRCSENRFGQIAGAAGRKVVWTRAAHRRRARPRRPQGSGRQARASSTSRRGRAETLVEKVDALRAGAADRTTLVVPRRQAPARHRRRRKRRQARARRRRHAPSRKSGWIDLERLRAVVEPRARVAADAARGLAPAARPVLGRPTCRASTGRRSTRSYAPLLERVATRGELSDLIWEMQGELGTSHAYEMGGDHRKPPRGRARLPRLPSCASADDGRQLRDHAHRPRRPLGRGRRFAAQRRRRRGQGRASGSSPSTASRSRASVPPQALLVHQAGTKVRADADARRRRRADARDVDRDRRSPTRCRRATANGSRSNRAWVHAQSKRPRRLLPPAGHDGRRLRRVPPLLRRRVRPRRADRRRPLQPRRPRLAAAAREGRAAAPRLRPCRAGSEAVRRIPSEAVAGPVVALTNEHAGSDGDIFSHMLQADGHRPAGRHAHLGRRDRHLAAPRAGRRHARPRSRSSRSGSTTSAGASRTTAPIREIEVDNAPQDHAAGRDRQLETALATALAKLGPTPAAVRRDGPRPRLPRPALPPRQRG